MQLSAQEMNARDHAKRIVNSLVETTQLKMTTWEKSLGRHWESTTISNGNVVIRISASTGGVISIDGDPFTKDGRLILNKSDIIKSEILMHFA